MKQVELLSPAGNYEALKGAVMAGADAVYLGGQLFGARAYADNFSEEEIIRGIRFAHLFGKKIYLTVNTLVKEKELSGLYGFLQPFYEAGLDGVIIQDLGVFSFIRDHFPGLELHISTQMSITGKRGASLLKKEGAVRVVPARELSLEEIRQLKEEAHIQVETFIHGAMCYSYSGQCLFSSLLGGRSGNRGRCAQPCRLPYRIGKGGESYPFSMKDMCTLQILPELLEAGIDSLKIEGRMKKPEYAAGVTAMYRKYIRRYYQDPSHYQVEEEDLAYLRSLYIRSSIGEGYYHVRNGKNMITLSNPAYSGSDDGLLSRIRKQYIEQDPVWSVRGKARLLEGQPASLTLTLESGGEKTAGVSVTVTGERVEEAKKQPLSSEKIKEQLQKSGGTVFLISELSLEADERIFLPVSALNRLRRDALAALENAVIRAYGLHYPGRSALPPVWKKGKAAELKKETALHVLVTEREQLSAALLRKPERIYLDGVSIDSQLYQELLSAREKQGVRFYLAFPYVVRSMDEGYMEKLLELLGTPLFDGALVRNLETIGFLKEKGNEKPLCGDMNLYAWNSLAYRFLKNYVDELYLPGELNRHEIKELQEAIGEEEIPLSGLLYGRLPLMLTANCIRKTTEGCRKISGYLYVKDRYAKEFPVYTDCICCYNILYNSVPLSLHKFISQKSFPAAVGRLDFTTESGGEAGRIMDYFRGLKEKDSDPFYGKFTTGHLKRGVE